MSGLGDALADAVKGLGEDAAKTTPKRPAPKGAQIDHRGRKPVVRKKPGVAAQSVGKTVAKSKTKNPGSFGKAKPIRGGGKAKTKGGSGGLAAIDDALTGRLTAGLVEAAKKNIKPGDIFRAFGAQALGTIADKKIIPVVTQTGERTANDAVDLVANAIPSAYMVAKTGVEKGPVEAGKMLLDPYAEVIKNPVKSAKEHPLNTFLLASGVEGAVGHGLGKAGRVAPSKTLRKAASTDRPAATKVVAGTNLKKPGRYSKDVIKKAVQVGSDKARKRKGKPQREMSSREIEKRVDQAVQVNEDVRRINRAETAKKADKALGKKPTAAVTLAAQNIINPTKKDLLAYREQVAAYTPKGKSAERTHKATVKAIDKAAEKMDEAAVAKAARESKAVGAPLQKRMARKTGLLDVAEAERAALKPYAIQKMGARDDGKRLVSRDGSPLSNEQILAHMDANGVSAPAFVTHAPNQRGAKNFYVAQTRPPAAIGSGRRTGESVRTGVMDVHPDTLVESAVRTQGRIDAAEGYGRLVRDFGYKPKGKLLVGNYAKVSRVVDELNAVEDATQFKAVRLVPQFSRKSQHDAMRGHATEGDAIVAAARGEGDGGQWVAVPKAAADRIADHAKADGQDPLMRAYGSGFRTTVLATNPRWLVGNTLEAALRAAVAHAGPRSFVTARKVSKAVEKQGGRDARMRLEAATQGGGIYATRARLSKKVNPDSLPADGALGKAVQGVRAAGETPAPRAVARVWHEYTKFVFDTVNGRIENAAQAAMFGKALRDSPLMADSTMKLSQRVIDDAAKGVRTDPNLVARLGQDVVDMYGRYSGFSPRARRAISSYTPFIPWTLNAIKFLAITLPKDHPVLTSLIVAANEATAEWRAEHGLTASFTDVKEGALPLWLQGSIPGDDGSHLRVSRYTPFGVTSSEGGILGGLADSVLPQFSGMLQNAGGKDWKGTDLVANGESPLLRNAEAVVASFITTGIPILGQAARVTGTKLPNDADSLKVEPSGTIRARKAFDPFMYTPGKPASAGKPGKKRAKKKTTSNGAPPPPAPAAVGAGSVPPPPKAASAVPGVPPPPK